MNKKYIIIFKLNQSANLQIISNNANDNPIIYKSKKEAMEIIRKSCINKYIYQIVEINI